MTFVSKADMQKCVVSMITTRGTGHDVKRRLEETMAGKEIVSKQAKH
jgi:hypothetical protein